MNLDEFKRKSQTVASNKNTKIIQTGLLEHEVEALTYFRTKMYMKQGAFIRYCIVDKLKQLIDEEQSEQVRSD